MDINVAGHKTSFAHEKNEAILERILNWLTVEGDWVLDFFAGSGTTAAVAHKLHRRFITIEQMDYIESLTLARLKNVVAQAGDSFIYAALMPWNQVFADEILAADSPEALQKIWQDMQQRAFLEPVADTLTTPDFAAELAHQPLDEQKRALFHLLDKNQLYVNLSEMADADFNISDTDRALNRQLYNPNE